jgi:hypothetical protein
VPFASPIPPIATSSPSSPLARNGIGENIGVAAPGGIVESMSIALEIDPASELVSDALAGKAERKDIAIVAGL